jgi:uncharacterized zinc-type alcohol dehydrogenase-like protein
MLETKAYAAHDATSPLQPYTFERRALRPRDVLIEILWCGICQSDLHTIKNDWGATVYPVVAGHEIIGRVAGVGSDVTKFASGDTVGVGNLVDSCRTCRACKDGVEQYCEGGGPTLAYNAVERDGTTPTQGGYSNRIVVDESFVLRVRAKDSLEAVAPLLCAGITTYSPLRHWKIGKGHRVGVLGLGGLGHLAVKLASAMGAEVTLMSGTPAKEPDARRLGAHEFVATSDEAAFARLAGRFDIVLDTVGVPHDMGRIAGTLRRDGVLVVLGIPAAEAPFHAYPLIASRRSIAGSFVGGIAETQEMLDFCAERNIVADVEVIRPQEIDGAFERMLASDVRYRFVVDLSALR